MIFIAMERNIKGQQIMDNRKCRLDEKQTCDQTNLFSFVISNVLLKEFKNRYFIVRLQHHVGGGGMACAGQGVAGGSMASLVIILLTWGRQ
jgi:hypothetical protein